MACIEIFIYPTTRSFLARIRFFVSLFSRRSNCTGNWWCFSIQFIITFCSPILFSQSFIVFRWHFFCCFISFTFNSHLVTDGEWWWTNHLCNAKFRKSSHFTTVLYVCFPVWLSPSGIVFKIICINSKSTLPSSTRSAYYEQRALVPWKILKICFG